MLLTIETFNAACDGCGAILSVKPFHSTKARSEALEKAGWRVEDANWLDPHRVYCPSCIDDLKHTLP